MKCAILPVVKRTGQQRPAHSHRCATTRRPSYKTDTLSPAKTHSAAPAPDPSPTRCIQLCESDYSSPARGTNHGTAVLL